jgi:hypothetical protein
MDGNSFCKNVFYIQMRNMKDSKPHFKTVYLPRKEKRLINAMYELACEGYICAIYTREMNKKQNTFASSKQVWHRFTRNSYYDSAIRNWCMLFGSRNEPTHYSKLLSSEIFKLRLNKIGIDSSVERLRELLLTDAGLTVKMHEEYHQATKKYRDMYLIHRQHSTDIINNGDLHFPVLDSAIGLFYSLYAILVQLADTFENDSITKYDFIYLSYITRTKLQSLIKQPIVEVIEILQDKVNRSKA